MKKKPGAKRPNFHAGRPGRSGAKSPPSRDAKPSSTMASSPLHLAHALLRHLQNGELPPLRLEDIADDLKISKAQLGLLRQTAQVLNKDGWLQIDKNEYCSAAKPILVEGTLTVHFKGFGFLQSSAKLPLPYWKGELFIPRSGMGDAINGDQVRAQVLIDRISPKGPEGRIVKLLRRQHKSAVATLAQTAPHNTFFAYCALFPGKLILLRAGSTLDLDIGDRVLFDLAQTSGEAEQSAGEICEKLASITDASQDIPIAIREFGLPSAHSQSARDEAIAFGVKLTPKDVEGRVDLRHWEIFTIDPDTAKDFDDGLSLYRDKERFYLGVHIADVAHFVQPASHLDREARQRCNSTYFPNFCLPMLPGQLSDELCSLKPKVDRLTVSVLMQFNLQGVLLKSEVHRSVIQSKCRMTYGEASQILAGKKTSPHEKALHLMSQLCQLLKAKRQQRGSIDLSIPEWVVKCDSHGCPLRLELHEYDISHQLVEEFMLKTNEVVAKTLIDRNAPLISRIHEAPSEDALSNFATFAAAFGFPLKPPIDTEQLQRLFAEVRDEPFAPQLFLSYIKSMKQATYDTSTHSGHFGLALEHYCHFTSPIRRYVDLTVMRSLFAPALTPEELRCIALECSDRERVSAKAEMNVLTLKKLRLLAAKLQGNERHFVATITKVSLTGITFELNEYGLESFLHISQLGDEYLHFDKSDLSLRGKSGRHLCRGEMLSLYLTKVDLIAQQADWALVPESKQTQR